MWFVEVSNAPSLWFTLPDDEEGVGDEDELVVVVRLVASNSRSTCCGPPGAPCLPPSLTSGYRLVLVPAKNTASPHSFLSFSSSLQPPSLGGTEAAFIQPYRHVPRRLIRYCVPCRKVINTSTPFLLFSSAGRMSSVLRLCFVQRNGGM